MSLFLIGSISGFSKFHVLLRTFQDAAYWFEVVIAFRLIPLWSKGVVVFVLGQNLQVDLMKCTEEAGIILDQMN